MKPVTHFALSALSAWMLVACGGKESPNGTVPAAGGNPSGGAVNGDAARGGTAGGDPTQTGGASGNATGGMTAGGAPSGGEADTGGGANTGGTDAGGGTNAGGGANTGGTDAGGGADAGGGVGGAGNGGMGGEPYEGVYPNGSCSEDDLRTEPPAGKEEFKADPISEKFPFSKHWIGSWGANTEPIYMGQTAMADFDDDGDLDFGAGQRDTLPGGYYWWERCTDDHWVTHKVGDGQRSNSSGDALDVDQDGLIDIVAGDSWFKNPGNSRDTEWERFDAGTPNAEDLTVGDINGDDMAEVLYVNYDIGATWFEVGDSPESGFEQGGSFERTIAQGSAWGDLNGDGANDWLISAHWWYENNGDGTSFTEHVIDAAANFDAGSAFNAPLTYIGDLDGDGDNDFAACSHWLGGQPTARLAWVENLDGAGTDWELHLLSDEGLYSHGVILADFDNDGDLDIFWARNVGPSFIWENTDGAGTFVEHRIVEDFRGHTPRIGDADCDGDLDIAGGPWGDRGPADHGESVGEPIRDYVYLRNLAVENGAPPIFDADRLPYELGWKEKYHCR